MSAPAQPSNAPAAAVAAPAPAGVKQTIRPFLARRRGAAAAAAGPGRGGPAAAPPPAEPVFQTVIRESPTVLRFRLSPANVAYANTLRRAMITEVESVGFVADIKDDGSTSDVKIIKNSTPMSNEMLAHRIGLLPIHVENPAEWNPATYEFKLKVVNEGPAPLDVVAGDIEVYQDQGADEEPLKLPSVQFFHPDPVTHDTALLAVLKGRVGDQEPEALEFTARATVGTGRQNVRFMPTTSRCAYGYTLDEDPERRREIFTRWLTEAKKVSPADLDANAEKKAQLEREFATMEQQRCYKIDARGEPYSYDFLVESVGVMDPTRIVGRALEVMKEKLLRYASIDRGDLPDTLRVRPAEARMKGYDFVFQGEDHTLGNLLSTWIDQTMMDRTDSGITFAGYKVPHPLRDEMLLRIGIESGKELDARAIVAEACRGCAQMFTDWRAMWAGATEGV